LSSQEQNQDRKPNWLILKEAAEELYRSGKTVFTRKELTRYARKLDPSRSEASLDFEIDLVTVNSNSKDRYRDPEKLFLYRIDRGRYTLYNPEVHGPIDEYVYRASPIRRDFIDEVVKELESHGYRVEVKQPGKALAPDIIARINGEKVSVWLIDPMQDPLNQMKNLAYVIGSIMLSRGSGKHVIILSSSLLAKIPSSVKDLLKSMNVHLAVLKEEKKYTLSI